MGSCVSRSSKVAASSCVLARLLTLKPTLVLPKCQVASASSGGPLCLGNQEVTLVVKLGMKLGCICFSAVQRREQRSEASSTLIVMV